MRERMKVPEMVHWPLIETAPKDGTVIVGGWNDESRKRLVFFSTQDRAWCDAEMIYPAPDVWWPVTRIQDILP